MTPSMVGPPEGHPETREVPKYGPECLEPVCPENDVKPTQGDGVKIDKEVFLDM